MNEIFNMKRQDLLELYQLTSLYQRSYPNDIIQELEIFLEIIGERYRKTTNGEEINQQSNPRNAGRKPVYTEEHNSRIIQLYRAGTPLRRIAEETGCSLGHVQDIIRHEKNV